MALYQGRESAEVLCLRPSLVAGLAVYMSLAVSTHARVLSQPLDLHTEAQRLSLCPLQRTGRPGTAALSVALWHLMTAQLTQQALKEEQRAVSGALRSLSKEMQVDGEAVAAYREVRPRACSLLQGLQSLSPESREQVPGLHCRSLVAAWSR